MLRGLLIGGVIWGIYNLFDFTLCSNHRFFDWINSHNPFSNKSIYENEKSCKREEFI